jgi:anaerobic selenocysteine-containing dehydrogenase
MKVKTACPLDCWDTCSIIAEVENGVVTRLSGDPDHPITQGVLCGKGRRLKDRMYSPHRLLHPLKKTEEGWHRISWEQAYSEITAKIQQVVAESGHHAILHNYDWGSGTVLKNLNQRFFYQLGGCTETVGSLCWDAGLEAQIFDFGQARSHHPGDLQHAKGIVVWGRNVSVTNMHMVPFIKTGLANGAKLVIVNPLPTDMDARADLILRPRPGTDGALALGALKYCKDQGWVDRAFLQNHTIGWTEFASYVDRFDLAMVERETDVPAEQVVALAEQYGQSGPVSTLLGLGLQRYAGGGNTIRSIDALAAATGQVGIAGGGVNYANRMVPEFLDEAGLSGRDKADVRVISRGSQAEAIMHADPPIQLMFVTRTNPVSQVPGTDALLTAYKTIPVKVVVDMFMTPTAELADYVLPCTTVLEEEDFVFSSMWHGYITYINKVVAPIGETKPDWLIFTELSERLGFGTEMRQPLSTWLQTALEPLRSTGVTLETLRSKGTIDLGLPSIPWSDYRFLTPSGKYEFYSEQALAKGHNGHAVYGHSHETHRIGSLRPASNASYPYGLLTIHPRLSENSQYVDFPDYEEYPIAEISTDIAQTVHLQDGDVARLWTAQAELNVRVKITKGTSHPYTIKMEAGWRGQGKTINHLTQPHKTDFGDQTAQYDCTCNIAPIIQSS